MDSERTVQVGTEVLSRLGVFCKDLEKGQGFPNRFWDDMGHTYREIGGREWLERVHPADRRTVRELLERHLRGETPEFRCEYRIGSREAGYRWFFSTGVVERRDAEGRPLVYLGSDVEVTGLHQLREKLQAARAEAEERAMEADALRGAGAVVVSTLDAAAATRSVVEQLNLLVPFDSAMVCEFEHRTLRLVGGTADVTEATWKEFAGRRLRQILRIISSRMPDAIEDGGAPLPHGLLIPLVVRGAAVGSLVLLRRGNAFHGDEVRVVMSMADYLSLALSNARMYRSMRQRAEIDQLSGVLTRPAYLEACEQQMDVSFHERRPLCCLVLDIDHFKAVNDTFGHATGDQVIRTLGSLLRDRLRSTDLIGRIGGEEFSALLTDTALETGVEVAERLRSSVAAARFSAVDGEVTASIGIAALEHASDGRHRTEPERLTIEQLIKRADGALYLAKSTGRNRVVRADSGPTDGGPPVAGD